MSESGPSAPQALTHRVTRMTGRDPDEPHPAATPLELLFDLTFVVGFGIMVFALHTYLVREGDPFHIGLLVGTAVVLAAAVWMAAAGVPMAWCLLIVMLAPAVTVWATRSWGTAIWRRYWTEACRGSEAARPEPLPDSVYNIPGC